jgi:hypothetical protein
MFILLAVFWAGLAHAQPDPLDAIRAFHVAVRDGEGAALRALIHAESPEQSELADAYVRVVRAGKQLADAAQQRFGASGATIASGTGIQLEIDRLDRAIVDVRDSTAKVTLLNQPAPIELRLVDGQWKVRIDNYAGADPPPLHEQVILLNALAVVLQRAAMDVQDGVYATFSELETALTEQMHVVLAKNVAPAEPSTQPSPAR